LPGLLFGCGALTGYLVDLRGLLTQNIILRNVSATNGGKMIEKNCK
jgi:hypothetical protein